MSDDIRIALSLPPIIGRFKQALMVHVPTVVEALSSDETHSVLRADRDAPAAVLFYSDRVTFALNRADAHRLAQDCGADVTFHDSGVWHTTVSVEQLARSDIRAACYISGLRALDRQTPSGAATDNTALGLDDLTEDIVEGEKWARGPQDMKEYWTKRRRTLQRLLGVRPIRLPKSGANNDDWNRHLVEKTAIQIVRNARRILRDGVNPLSAWHEIPEEVGTFVNQHSEELTSLTARVEEDMAHLIRECLKTFFPTIIDRRIPWSQMEAAGVARQPPRDLFQIVMDGDY